MLATLAVTVDSDSDSDSDRRGGHPVIASRRRNNLIAMTVAAAAVLLLALTPCIRVVAITGERARVYSREALGGFVISYTHSVNKGRVHDHYTTEGGTLVLDRSVFVSYGAGIMEPQEESGAKFSVTDEGYEISGLNRRIKTLYMAVGLVAEHTIETGGDVLVLKDVFGAQRRIRISVKRASILGYICWRYKTGG